MKAKATVSILCLSIFFSYTMLRAQGNPVKILLTVNTQEINQSNIDKTSNFGQRAGISNEDFTTDVQVGDMVIWKAKSSSRGGDKVIIKAIIYADGTNLFESKKLNDNNTPGAVVGTVVNGVPNDIEKYIIKFEVLKRGEDSGEIYKIDPKLKVIPSE